MATNLALDDNLIIEAQNLSGSKTKKETVNLALKEYIQRHKQEELLTLFDSIDFDEKFDYKKSRFRK
jgi:Arc/MetJ family transcription regulator